MCDKKPCDNCCHEEDLLCCMPIKHCCGGYSEHNNCCPHDRCCNHPCGGCDCCDGCGGCPFGPEPCCCKAMKCCKKCKEELEKLTKETAKISSDVDEVTEHVDEIYDELTDDIGKLQEDVSGLDAKIDGVANDLDDETQRAIDRENQIEDNSIADVEYDRINKKIIFKNEEGDVICEIDASDFIKDGMLQSVDLIENTTTHNKELKFVFNTDAGTTPITIDIGDIFETSDYYNKTDIDLITNNLKDEIEDKIPSGSYDPGANKAIHSINISNGQITGTSIDVPTTADITNSINSAVSTAIGGLDSEIQAQTNKAIASVVVTNGVITGHTKIDVPTNADITNAITTAINSLDSSYEPGAHKAVHSVTLTDGVLDGSPIDVVSQVNIGSTQYTPTDGAITLPAYPDAQIQSDWNQSNSSAVDFIKNKPTIPAAQQQSDWNASSGVTAIANKPTLVTKIQIGPNGTVYNSNGGDTIQIPAYPSASDINVTIDGTTYNLQTLLGDIINRIEALEEDSLWELNSTTGYVTTKNSKSAAANEFYDTSVS